MGTSNRYMQKNSVTTKQQWTKAALNDPKYFSVVGSGVEAWIGKKNFLSTKSVQGTKIVAVEGEIDYLNRPSRANMQPKLGRVAFAKMKDTFKVLVADEMLSKKYILSTGFALIEPSIDSNYLYQYFQSEVFNAQKNRYCEGSTQQAISQSDFANIEILFPINCDEQKRIAEVLELIDQTIEQTDSLIKKYERVRVGMTQDLFQYGVDEKGNLRTTSAKWQMMPLEKVAIVSNGTTPSMTRDDYWDKGTVPWLSSGKINDYVISTPSELVTERALKETSLRLFPKDTVLVAMVGQGKTRGMSARLAFPSTINQNLAGIITSSQLDAKFLHYYLDQHYSELRAIGRGSNQDALTCSLLQQYEIPVPLIEEQRRISSRLFQIEELTKKELNFKNKLSRLKNGLMRDLLTGAVRTVEK